MSLTLNLADQLKNFPVSSLNGPGLRYILWVQGCSVRCTTDCLNPDYLAHRPKVVLPVETVAAYIFDLPARRAIEGVTFLGGEPFDQAAALAELGCQLQANELSIVTYTGHTLEHLQRLAQPDWLALLAITDLLIDGPFLPDLQSDTLRWRGSANQRLIFLTGRYTAAEIATQPVEKGVNIIIRPDGTVKISGMQNKKQLDAMIEVLKQERFLQ